MQLTVDALASKNPVLRSEALMAAGNQHLKPKADDAALSRRDNCGRPDIRQRARKMGGDFTAKTMDRPQFWRILIHSVAARI